MSFVKQNLKEMGTQTFKLLHCQMKGDSRVKRVLVKARLEIRESTKKETNK
jgi:LacI family transcriptional regulator